MTLNSQELRNTHNSTSFSNNSNSNLVTRGSNMIKRVKEVMEKAMKMGIMI